jgi:hypothetical protein
VISWRRWSLPAEFRRWYAEFDADLWDRQVEADPKNGKLDFLVE